MGNYVTKDDVLKEVPAGTDPARIDSRINKWEQIVERLTRNIFRVIEPGELIFKGSNTRYLHFSLPLVEVISVKINDDDTALDSSEYRAFIGKSPPQDDRQNPKIELIDPDSSSIFRTNRAGIFAKGYDQKIEAKWGYVESDLTTPVGIKDAIIQLVVLDIDGYFERSAAGGGAKPLTAIRRERTDGHELEYMEQEDVKVIYSFIPRDIYDLIMLFRAPWKIAVPDPRVFEEIPTTI